MGFGGWTHVRDHSSRRIIMETKPSSDIVPHTGLPLGRDPTLAYRVSLIAATLIAFVSIAGFLWGHEGLYGDEYPSVLVARGGDVANLVLVPVLLGSMWLARRGALVGSLLWPGALFY